MSSSRKLLVSAEKLLVYASRMQDRVILTIFLEEVDAGDGDEVAGHEDEISLPLQPIEYDRADHGDGEVPQPVAADTNGSTASTSL